MSIRRYLLSACVYLISLGVFAEKPPLTLETAESATGFMEWVLDVRFNAEQRQRYQQILSDMWRGNTAQENETIAKMAQIYQKLPQLGDGERSQMRAKLQADFVKQLETGADEPSRWLFSIYRAAHADSADSANAPLGRWTDGYISSIQYKNAYTGVSAPTNGRSFAYDFKADGTYSFTGLMQSVVYNCTTSMFSNETGSYTISGDTISLKPERNPYRMTNNCAPLSNREGPGKLNNRTLRFRIVSENGRRYLELRSEDGALQRFGESR